MKIALVEVERSLKNVVGVDKGLKNNYEAYKAAKMREMTSCSLVAFYVYV